MSPIKQKIKDLSAEQVSLKNQRKTVHLVGERTISPSTAAIRHSQARYELRYLFIAYAIIRGKDPVKADAAFADPSVWMKRFVQKLVDQYTAEYEAQKERDLRASEQSA